jgi:hypothetical protein
MKPIRMERYRLWELENAIKNNEQRGYEIVKQWEQPNINKWGETRRIKYIATMNKIKDSNKGVMV